MIYDHKIFTALSLGVNVINNIILFTSVIYECFVLSQSDCLWQAFLAFSNVCKEGQEPTLE